jgi:4-amino-4-deoxy-L-arabinose transferase-like glycosyltransferase
MGQYEPSILERLTALTYLATGGERIWVARLYNSLFWLIGGAALFDLARRMAGSVPWAAALVALAYYLTLPFGVQASRSFQPDPGMAMWMMLAIYALYRWSEEPKWIWAILAGAFGGVAVVTKVVAAYAIGAGATALVLYTLGLRRFWRNAQVYVMAGLMIAPTALYYLTRGERATEFLSSWTLALSHLLLDPAFYVRWFSLIQDLMGLAPLLLALIGVLVAQGRNRALLLGLWIGYGMYGLFLPYQMSTHNYYHLQLVGIVAISLLPILETIVAQVSAQTWIWRVAAIAVALIGLTYTSWVSIVEQMREDHRNEPAYWQEIASQLPEDGKIIGLTQDYGYRIMYYGWRKVIPWPNSGERELAALRGREKELQEYFDKKIEDKSYFLITSFNQFNNQPDLKKMLNDHYPVHAEGSGYLIYDLEHPLAP